MQKDEKKLLISEFIMRVVKGKNPLPFKQLAAQLSEEYGLTEKEAIKQILALQSYGSLKLRENADSLPGTLRGHLLSLRSLWYWITITLAVATTITVFTIPENLYPFIYARYVLGSLFVLWLPGYSFIKALFPTKPPIPTGRPELDSIERAALSAGMSLALVPITGLLLNYTPWGIRVTPVTLSLLALTVACATAALLREQAAARSTEAQRV